MKSLWGRSKGKANCVLVLALLVFSFTACKAQSGKLNFSASQPAPPPDAASSRSQDSYADVVSRVSPAVVTVHSTERGRTAQQFPFSDDPFFRDFFGDRAPQQRTPRRVQGIASGVIVSQDGYVLTNHHVVDGAVEIRVETTDNRTFVAKLVGSDQPSDLAVLKIEAKDLPVLALGNSDQVRVGDIVLAVGNPLGIGQTVTSGIISAKGRATGLSDGSFEDFLQTDASINRGNSGGALVNTAGELIGVNSQILSPSGGSIGIGFAIPSNMARLVMEQLVKSGKVTRGMIGVTIQSITPDLAASLNLPAARGALVSSVSPGGPGEKAGIRSGDVIIAINEQPIIDSNSLRNTVASTPPGTRITVTLLRDSREQKLNVILAELPATQTARTGEGGSGESPAVGKFGLTLEALTPELASRLGSAAADRGLVVTKVEPGGVGADAGIREGDLIQEVNRQPVGTIAEFSAALQRSGARPALILVRRREATIFLTLRPAP